MRPKPVLSVYVVHHPREPGAEALAASLFRWFRLSELHGPGSSGGFPVWYRRSLTPDGALTPAIAVDEAEHNLVIVLVGDEMALDPAWRGAVESLAAAHGPRRGRADVHLLPVSLTDAMGQLDGVGRINGVRLPAGTAEVRTRAVLHAATEVAARALLGSRADWRVFISHAKADGRAPAAHLRDALRRYGQMEAWFDENDLPHSKEWAGRIAASAREGTAALLAVVSPAYPTRPWCRLEANAARTPRRSPEANVWTTQPAVAVDVPGPGWVRALPALAGVPHTGWVETEPEVVARGAADRLALEVLLHEAWRRTAAGLAQGLGNDEAHFLAFLPDPWTIQALLTQLPTDRVHPLYHPGSGLRADEAAELEALFDGRVRFHSFDTLLPSPVPPRSPC